MIQYMLQLCAGYAVLPFTAEVSVVLRNSNRRALCALTQSVVEASATEAVDPVSIPGLVKPKTWKIDIHSFLAWPSAIKGTVWSLHRVFNLDQYGIRGAANDIIKPYPTNRKQFVSKNGYSSSLLDINIGLPRGSVLGPILFLIYINDLSNCCNFKTM